MNARRNAPRAGTPEPDERLLREILGYLNFSGGKADSAFQRNWNALFVRPKFFQLDSALPNFLLGQLARLQPSVPALADAAQATAVVKLVFEECLPAYRRHHSDLLFHLQAADFRQPFFLARMIEAVLEQGAPWDESERIIRGTLDRLNDFVGYRPVAVLENGRQMEPYPHERFRPIPVYIRDAETANGPYHDLVERRMSTAVSARHAQQSAPLRAS